MRQPDREDDEGKGRCVTSGDLGVGLGLGQEREGGWQDCRTAAVLAAAGFRWQSRVAARPERGWPGDGGLLAAGWGSAHVALHNVGHPFSARAMLPHSWMHVVFGA